MTDYNKEIGDRMRIGYSFWGYLTPFEENTIIATPDGERGNRVDFVEEMLKRGHHRLSELKKNGSLAMC